MATADYLNVLQKLYVAYFGRPADTGGLQWAAQFLNNANAPVTVQGLLDVSGSNPAVQNLLNVFGNSQESLDLYSGTSTVQRVTAIYNFVLDRAPDAGGLTYWVAEIDAGRLSLARASLAILAAAERNGGQDGQTVANKIAVATVFTASLDSPSEIAAYAGNAAASAARDLLLTVSFNSNPNGFQPGINDTVNELLVAAGSPAAPLTFTPASGSTQGAADASTAIALPGNFVLVGDDEGNALRVFDRAGGQAVKEIFFGDYLGIANNELDLEASTQIGNTLYFIGSHGNSSSGADANNREWIFSAALSGTGAETALAFTGRFSGLEAALVAWDQSNAHGQGANFFGFAAGSASGSPESNSGFGIEGLTASPDNGALWIAFRAPVTGGGALNKALIVPITNIAAVLAGTAAPVFGAAIGLDLGGRGIRSIEKNADGQYLILAGPTGQPSADVPDDFRLYTWNGTASGGNASGLVQQAVALDTLLANGASFETIVQVPAGLSASRFVQLLQDDGATMRPGSSTELKDLPISQQSFLGNWVQLGGPAAPDTTGPRLVRSSPVDGASNVASSGNLILTFNEPVRAGSGNFVLTANGEVPVNIAANAAGVNYEYNTITFSSAALGLLPGTSYTFTAASGVVRDAAGNAFGGIAAGALDFSTAAAPVAVSLIITEVNSNATGGDFFELFNFGSTAIDLTGFRWDDNSLDPAMGASFAAGTVLAAGARLVVGVDTSTVATLRSNWNIPVERDVVAIGGPGLGTGDAVALFNASGALVAAVNYGSAAVTANGNTVPVVTRADGQVVAGTVHAGPAVGGAAGANGVSLVWDGVSTTSPAYQAAVAGQNNGYAQPGAAANIGSPGLLPADRAPVITSNAGGDTAAINYAENGTAAITTVTATDANAGDLVGYSITGGADAARFSVNPTTGVLTFLASPDFETPTDAGLNNVYDVIVSARDRIGLTDSQAIAVTVTDVAEGPAATLISAIQGAGDASPLVGQTVTVQARVTAWVPGQNLFYLMEETADRDGNVLTSEGIAVAYTGTSPVDANSIGDTVRLSGVVAENFGQTQITYTPSSLSVVFDGTTANLDAPRVVTLPIASGSTLERFEGELITVQSANAGGLLHVADTFTFARFGETTLYADAVPFQFTETNAPSVSGNAAYLDFLGRNSIQIDDGSNLQNPSLTALNSGTRIVRDTTNDGVTNGTALGADGMGNVNFIRVGDTTQSVTGVLGFSFDAYDLTPTQTVNLTANPRPPASPAPDVGAGAEVKVASFNVLNYFTTLGTATFTNPAGVVHEGRGASNAAEFTQQQAKIVAAMLATGAHVFGLNELQNNGDAGAIASLVSALNAAAGSNRFAAIGGHANGTDAIRVGIVYDQTVVKPLGLAVTPNTATYSAFAAQNRLPVAQTFSYLNDDSKQFTLVVNHLKSKGGTGTGADADLGDGTGQFNATRLEAAQQLVTWLNTNPTGATDGDYLLVGDLNSYSREAPVTFFTGNGYTEAANAGDYSYLFDGLRGSLDHILYRGLGSEVTGFSHFNINADEQVALDYNDEFGDGSVNVNLDRNDLYRSSDHDPVIIGLRLNSEAGSPAPPAPDTTAPTLVSSTPADNATGVGVGANIVLTFSEAVRAGSGNIVLNGIDPATPDLTIAVTDPQVSISGNTVTINPTADLLGGQAYAVQLAPGVIEDLAGNDFAGFVDNTTLNFSTAVSRAYFSLAGGNFMEDWTDTSRISANDNWGGVPFVVGYRGDDITSATGVDPQTLLGEGTVVVNVLANQTAPNTVNTGGVIEFQLTDPVVALNGSGTADAPHLVLLVDATGRQNITVSYNLRDIDGSADNAVQPVALQYRIGETGNFINLPAGFVADASSGPNLATLVTAVTAVLPTAANGAAQLQIRIITANAVGNDEAIGIDDIVVSSQAIAAPPPAPATAPSGTDATLMLAEDSTRSFNAADFMFTDADTPMQTLAAVRISTLPVLGTLRFNNVTITQEQVDNGYEVLAANLGQLSYTPAPDGNGSTYASFSFQLRDTGSTANGGVNLDATPNTLTFNVTPVNDAPVISGVPVAAQMVTAGTAAALADFTVLDVDGDNLSVTLTTTNGTLNGLTDADAGTPGIQLAGTQAAINAAIAAATFTATAAGAASIGISVTDGMEAMPATATYSLTAAAAAPVALTAGSIAFVGFNADGNDGYAFVVVDAIAAGQVIYFRDDEWNGTAFNDANEGRVSWTNNTGATITAGTLIELVNLSAGTLSANIGLATSLSGNRQALGNSDEALYAYTSSSDSLTGSFSFLAAFANSGFDATRGLLTGTGLSAGATATAFTNGHDVFAYNASTAPTNFAHRTAGLTPLNTTSNWLSQDGSGNQDADNITPDAPFLTDPDSPLVTTVGMVSTPAVFVFG